MDDEADIRDIMTLTIQDSGYKVLTAPDGKSGIGLCEQVNPQLVITDIRMPGMDGIQVLKVLKERLPDIEVIVATAYGEMDLAIRALQLDAFDFSITMGFMICHAEFTCPHFHLNSAEQEVGCHNQQSSGSRFTS